MPEQSQDARVTGSLDLVTTPGAEFVALEVAQLRQCLAEITVSLLDGGRGCQLTQEQCVPPLCRGEHYGQRTVRELWGLEMSWQRRDRPSARWPWYTRFISARTPTRFKNG